MEIAGDVYELHFDAEKREGFRALGAAVWQALEAAAMGVGGGSSGGPSLGDYVITRRSDGEEVLRVDAESDEDTAYIKDHLVTQLSTLTPEEFREAWSIAPTSA